MALNWRPFAPDLPAWRPVASLHREAGHSARSGLSRRFGANKLLQPLADSIPMVVLVAAHHCVPPLPNVLAIVNPGDPTLARLLDEDGFPVWRFALGRRRHGSQSCLGSAPDSTSVCLDRGIGRHALHSIRNHHLKSPMPSNGLRRWLLRVSRAA